jgi:hypothetical protein
VRRNRSAHAAGIVREDLDAFTKWSFIGGCGSAEECSGIVESAGGAQFAGHLQDSGGKSGSTGYDGNEAHHDSEFQCGRCCVRTARFGDVLFVRRLGRNRGQEPLCIVDLVSTEFEWSIHSVDSTE